MRSNDLSFSAAPALAYGLGLGWEGMMMMEDAGLAVTAAEFQDKLMRLRAAIAEAGADGVVLDTAKNVSWLTGMRTYVSVATDQSLARLIVLPDRVLALTSNNEVERFEEEEARGLPLVWDAYPWFDAGIRDVKTTRAISGHRMVQEAELESRLLNLRVCLSEPERARARRYGAIVGRVIYEVAASLHAGMTENDVAGALSGRLMAEGFQPLVVLVAADHRCGLRPHPLPTTLPIRHRALMAVSVLVPQGLILSVTRQAVLEEPTELEEREHHALQTIFTAITSAASAGTEAPALWETVREAYAANGFPDGFLHHHQGGLAGYQGRETFLRPDSTWMVPASGLLAFNPTGGATKAEDTILVEGRRFTPVTLASGTPTEPIHVSGQTWMRPSLIIVK